MRKQWFLRVAEDKNGKRLEIWEFGSGKTERLGKMRQDIYERCRNVLRLIVSKELDERGVPAGYEKYLTTDLNHRGDILLSDETGAKLALLFILHDPRNSPERLELMAWRIERFTREEALYWLSKVTIPTYGKKSLFWAKWGLQMMLAGRENDKEVVREILGKIRR